MVNLKGNINAPKQGSHDKRKLTKLAVRKLSKSQLSHSRDGYQTNSRRYDDLLFIHSVNYFWMISFL